MPKFKEDAPRRPNGGIRYPSQSVKYRRKAREKLAGRPKPERCEICGDLPGGKPISFDHDHKTGKFLGWLCMNCNTALGLCRDDPLRLEALARYLRNSGP